MSEVQKQEAGTTIVSFCRLREKRRFFAITNADGRRVRVLRRSARSGSMFDEGLRLTELLKGSLQSGLISAIPHVIKSFTIPHLT